MTYKFNDFKDFVSAVLKDSKILVAGLPIVIGSLTLPAVKAQQLSNYAGLTPSMEKNGVALLSTTITQKDFLFQSFEARYGADFKNKFMEGKYNLGLTVGTNTLLFDKKPTTDKLFEQVNLAANLSKIFGKEINLKIGFDKKLNNYKLEGFNIVEASKGSRAQAALISKKVFYTGLNYIKKKDRCHKERRQSIAIVMSIFSDQEKSIFKDKIFLQAVKNHISHGNVIRKLNDLSVF